MKAKIKQLIPLVLFITVLGVLLWFSSRYINVGPREIQEWIQSFGVWAPLLFILIYTIRPLILFPASVISLAGGLAFGAFEGFLYILIGATSSAAVAFWVSRLFEKSFVKRKEQGRISEIMKLMEKRGFFYVLVLRFIPLLNFDVISYAAGLASVRFRSFILATVLGIIPGTFGYAFIGSSFAQGDTRVIVISVLAGVALIAIPVFYRKRVASWLGIEKVNKP
ncbi:TVP38/TMEM64 family protein [Jeotgalibacillus proteolyticus]|uniref:TVP38/TMEM64 family protein n=1 Tax=Jeotgalibacillus proteolyticus TaxID=2082395 RepID=UPI003CF81BC7